jgi:hypothetical protein
MHCFRKMDPTLFERLKSMTRAEREIEFEKATGVPERGKWEYENPAGEAELILQNEQGDSK